MNRTLSTLLILGVMGFVAGCSRAPSEDDIKTAYTHEVDQTNSISRKIGGDSMSIKVNSLKKLNCQEGTTKGQYLCKVDIDTTLPLIGRHQLATTLTLAKGDTGDGTQGWVIVRGLDNGQ